MAELKEGTRQRLLDHLRANGGTAEQIQKYTDVGDGEFTATVHAEFDPADPANSSLYGATGVLRPVPTEAGNEVAKEIEEANNAREIPRTTPKAVRVGKTR